MAVSVPEGISLVIPAYNEAGNIRHAVECALPVIRSLHSNHELIVVESGSTDGTGQILDELAIRHPALRVIHQGAKLGLGSALIEGFNAARFERLLYVDGDNPYDVAAFREALPLLEVCDIINGYRLSRNDPWVRRGYTVCFRLAMRVLFNVRLRDANIGFKLMRRSVIQSLHLTSRGFLIDAELLIKAQRQGYRIREFGVAYQQRTAGQSTVTAKAAMIIGLELLRLRWRLWWSGIRRVSAPPLPPPQAASEPTRRMVLTADDFGLSPRMNQGIVECCREGLVTRVSLMVNLPSAEEALAMIRSFPHVAVGLHLNLVKGRPLLDPRRVPSLVNRHGEFYTLLPFLLRVYTGRVKRDELAAEILAQFEWARAHGVTFHHVDSHRHTHLFAPVFKLVQESARVSGVPRIRIPLVRGRVPGAWSPKQRAFQVLARRAATRLTPPAVPVAEAYAELRLLMAPYALERFLSTVGAMGVQRVEIGCHPGYTDQTLQGIESQIHDRDMERRVLTDPALRQRLRQSGWEVEGALEQRKEVVVCG